MNGTAQSLNIAAGGLTVPGRSLFTGGTRIGGSGSGRLAVQGGGLVNSAAVFLFGGGNGTIAGPGSQWTTSFIEVGVSGPATLTIEAGGLMNSPGGVFVGAFGGIGTATVNGAGSRWTHSFLQVNDGSLLVSEGGTVSGGTTWVGAFPGNRGTLSVFGDGSGLFAADMCLGSQGDGALAITHRGNVSTAGTFIAGCGGQSAEAVGFAVVNGVGSQWTTTILEVGAGGTGTLTIEEGGRVNSTGGGFVGAFSGSGTAVIRNAGSRWALPFLQVHRGSLTIESGGVVDSGDTSIGTFSDNDGAITVDGIGSQLLATNLCVGCAGKGQLIVQNGALASTTAMSNARTVTIADGAALTVDGSYTQLQGFTNLIASGNVNAASVVINAGVLQGTGSIAGATTIAAGASLAPGADSPSGGMMTFGDGSLTLHGTLTEFLAPNGIGVTAVDGAVTLDSATSVLDIRQDSSYVPPVGTTLAILTANTVINTRFHRIFSRPFNNHTELWNVRYNDHGNNIVLVAMEGCGDERTDLILEYITYRAPFTPSCDTFTQSAHPPSFTFLDLIGDDEYNWALIKEPLVIDNGYWGLEKLRSELVIVLPNNFPHINSGFRNPASNVSVGGRPQSRHLFGDAVDFENYTKSFHECESMVQAANNSLADYVRDCAETASQGYHLHADWRFHPGVFQP